jgi:hypothetical protein
VPPKNSRRPAKHLPNAQPSIHPTSGHGFLFQRSVKFAKQVNAFLDS